MRKLLNHIITLALLSTLASAQDRPPFPPPPADVSSTTIITSANEPGEQIVITGTVYTSDGKTPYPNMVLFFYQADNDGLYNKTDNSYMRPRLHGWVKTGKNGEYTINTIKPGSYPNSRQAAHIHAIVQLPGERPKWIDDFLFDDDPFLTNRDRQQAGKGSFSHIMKTRRGNKGILHAERNIILN
jgi:protocatechuate 3,4-dioxygenase beta subunit